MLASQCYNSTVSVSCRMMIYEVTDEWHQRTLMYSSHFVGHPAVPLLRVSLICWDALRKFGNCQRLVHKNVSC